MIFLVGILFYLNIVSMDNYYKELIGQVFIREQERIKAEQENRLKALEKKHSIVQTSRNTLGRNAQCNNELLMWHELDRREKEEAKK